MTDHSCCGVLASAPFKFLVGHNKTLFTMHTALITHHSKPFGKPVSGPMLEAKEGCARLEDVDEHAIVRFGQYAYAGDYAPLALSVCLVPSLSRPAMRFSFACY